jgi:small subunit ribosomal protein S17
MPLRSAERRAERAYKPPARGRDEEGKAMTEPAGTGKTRGRRRRRSGLVTSDKGDKTITVEVTYSRPHPKYGKMMRMRTRLRAHDEQNQAKVGDRVELASCRRISKSKAWRLVRVLDAAPTT